MKRTNRRVAIVTESYLPTFNGVTNSVVQVSKQLAARGSEVLIIAPAIPPSHTEPSRESWGPRVERIRSVLLPGKTEFRVGVPTRAVAKLLKDFRPDVVHLASPALLGAAAVTASRSLRIPTVSVFQTNLSEFARTYGFRATLPIDRWLRFIHNRADVTLAPSTSTARMLSNQGIQRVHLWGRGVDSKLFDPAKRDDELRKQLAPLGQVIVGFVGRLAPEKRVDLLASLNDRSDLKIVVVGDGPARNLLQQRLPNGTFLGAQYGEELAKVFASLDVFVHTGPHETFCQTVQEAMASGLPVVAPAIGGPVDLVRHQETGLLFEPDSPRALSSAVAKLAGDAHFRSSAGDAARRYAEGNTWEAITDQLLGYYDSVAPDFSRDSSRISFIPDLPA